MSVGKLTATKVNALKPKDKVYQESDGGGLALQVNTNGSKWWRFRYQFDGKSKTISMGTYPEISLKEARGKRDKARNQVANGINPSQLRKDVKNEKIAVEVSKTREVEFSFEILARAILEERFKRDDISETHYNRTLRALENYAFKSIGAIEVKDIKPNDIKRVVRKLSDKGVDESARKLFYSISKIFKTIVTRADPEDPLFDYGVEVSPTVSIDVTEITKDTKVRHYPVMTDKKDIKGLLLSIDEYSGNYPTKMAMKLLPHIFLRSYNIRHLEWKEVDFEDRLIRIPAEKMKTKQDFLIPMSTQVIEILEEMYEFSGEKQYVFPSIINPNSPMSDNTMISALRRMGYSREEFVPHSWRSVFATIANENGKHFESIEASLAHSIGSGVSRAYNRAQYLEQRKELMQWWSEWLDTVKTKKEEVRNG